MLHRHLLIGWQEWCALPKLHLPAIKAKIDTGAKTSALHAAHIKPFHRHGILFVHFKVHPLQGNNDLELDCTAPVVDHRLIMNSGGHKELRYIIRTAIALGILRWDIEISLTNREPLAFRMLLGRDALTHDFLIEPGKKLYQGKYTKRQLRLFYNLE
jgi:hypothetical protein